ncbi:hypothetical protein Hanom_Chr11g01031121 [Helianthus anomalus]
MIILCKMMQAYMAIRILSLCHMRQGFLIKCHRCCRTPKHLSMSFLEDSCNFLKYFLFSSKVSENVLTIIEYSG